MEIPPSQKNILLIGFMGSGKSSVGRIIAPRMNLRFVDTDQWIVQSTGQQITEIFKNHGETFFRDRETAALEALAPQTGQVVSTGGGIILRERNVALLRQMGLVVWLTADEDVIFERVSRNTKRPLLQTENPRETIHDLLTARMPLYAAAAHLTIDTSRCSHEEVADAIIFEAQLAN